ncbi:hypothetical protein [Paenibacillus macquariensis]|uniref:Uncharacterized protein n=1 Tax=Paenibacillus macquariensis TaxID=948756 RepID=A0ABY1JX25_9BACL|nr:hypothetical protein [Paenibacillus macquariensis]MEC0089376.1 hypothetical protein [Paenibacillus macquariensis]SIQ92615.1 hypothetical protein SAMN05421578_10581 [Paenibacillus macquariensis]
MEKEIRITINSLCKLIQESVKKENTSEELGSLAKVISATAELITATKV